MDILIIVSHKEHYPFFKQFINYIESNVDYAINRYCGHKHFNNFSTINYCFLFDNQKVIQQMNKIKEQFPENEISFVRIIYYDQIKFVETIERYWVKYRWKFRKKRMDPLKRELMEYCYHPSRLTFDV